MLNIPAKPGANEASRGNIDAAIDTTYEFNFCARFPTRRVVSPIILIYKNNQLKKHFQGSHLQPNTKGHIYPNGYI